MPSEKIAVWNIYFSWKLVETRNGVLRTTPGERKRAENVAEIINEMDAGLLGIVECMSPKELKYYVKTYCPQYDGMTLNGDSDNYNLGILYKKSLFSVRKEQINTKPWKARIGNDSRNRTYKFARIPLVVSVTHKVTGTSVLIGIMHTKSKRPPDDLTGRELWLKNLNNRQRIIAACTRIRELLFAKIEPPNSTHQKFIIMGDLNDGPDFDEYERKVARSGVETVLGSVLDPDHILFSAISLADGKGQPSCSFQRGSIQLDHIVHTQNMLKSPKPRVVKNSGKVRSDLVNIKRDGKKRDSDHAPVEIVVSF